MFTALKIWEWIKSKWQWFLGGLVGLVPFLAFLTRGKQQKQVLDIANKSHEKENSINEKAKEDLVEGLAKISEEKDKKVKEVIADSVRRETQLEKEKNDLIDEATESEDLGRRLAEALGAEYVETDDK